MKKQAKGIIALSAVLAAMLGGGYAYMKLTPEEGKGGNNNTNSTMELIATQAVGQGTVLISDNGDENAVVKSAVIKNSEGVLNIVMKEIRNDEGETVTVYTFENGDDINADTSKLTSLINDGNGLQAKELIAEGCDDLSKYGLDSPAAEVELTYESGNKVKLYLGDDTPSGDATYCMVDGKKDVYIVSAGTIEDFKKGQKDFISKVVLAKPENNEYPIIKSLRIQRGDMDEDMLIEYDDASSDKKSGGTSASHKLVSPVESYLAVEKSTDITTGMFGLTASGIDAVDCNDEDIKKAGLDAPFCTVTMDCDDGNTYKLLLSEPFTDDNGNKCSNAMFEGGKVIFIVPVDNAKWLTVNPIDIVTRLLITNYVWNITEMSVKDADEDIMFIISPKDKDNIPDSPKSSDFIVKKNGEDFDSERYRLFYSFLTGTNAEEFAVGVPVPDGEPMAVLQYYDDHTKTSTTYEFYDDSLMRSLIVINGESKYYCTKSYVNTLIENIKRIGTGEDYIKNW